MLRVILTRLATAVPLLFVLSVLVFLMVYAVPGSVAEAMLQDGATPEAVAELEEQLGLRDPLPVQYFRWLGNALRGNFGDSYFYGKSVTSLYASSLPITMTIAFGGLLIGAILGISLGVIAGLQPGSLTDRVSTILASLGVALPAFWIGMILVIYFGGLQPIFGTKLDWFPVTGWTPLYSEKDGWNVLGWLNNIFLPCLALGIPSSALIARQMRSSMANVLQTSYIRAQRAMGLSRWQIVSRHALKNAMIPVITVIGFRAAVAIGSAIVVEQVFGITRGAGNLLISSTITGDFPMVQGGVMIIALLIVIFNLLIDISYAWLNPKVRIS